MHTYTLLFVAHMHKWFGTLYHPVEPDVVVVIIIAVIITSRYTATGVGT